MRTERATELLKHFKDHGISQEPGDGLRNVLEYQDIIGHSTIKEVANFDETLDQDGRKGFIWTNFLTLAQDSAIDILKKTVINRWLTKHAKMLEEDYYKRVDEYNRKQNQLDDCKKHIYKRISKLEAENSQLRSRLGHADEERAYSRDRNRDLALELREAQNKAKKFDDVKALLA